ncbi:MAG: shikimate kinase [Flavobacteriaceae bacterium]|nr:shikimate kinase [Flavobacteriaceae bacterium]
MDKIILLGYMCSGKSTIGKMVAQKLNLIFIDLDQYIEEHEKLSVSDIFAQKGEIYFRTVENKYLKQLISNDQSFVLSLGGGTPCFAGNMDIIADQPSFYLQASIKTLSARISSEKQNRPLVAHLNNEDIPEFVAKHLFERNVFYSKASNIINIDNKSIDSISDEIIEETKSLSKGE